MSRPRSESGGPAAAASNRRRRALTYDDLPPEMKDAIQDYLRHTNESLRAAVAEYFEDKAACERRHGKIGTWDVSRVTNMRQMFYPGRPSRGRLPFAVLHVALALRHSLRLRRQPSSPRPAGHVRHGIITNAQGRRDRPR